MNHWFFVSLGDGVLAFDPKGRLCEEFPAALQAAGHQAQMAVFTRHELEGRLQCEVVAYFTPAAHAWAQRWDAQPCAQPTPHDLDLLIGTADATAHFFGNAP